MQKLQFISVKGIINNCDKVLMLKDHKGIWELPGGRVDFGENPKNALEREIAEELGINNAEIGDVIDVWDFSSVNGNNHYHFILIVYECLVDINDIRISDEHIETAWVSLTDIDNLEMRSGYKNSLNKFERLKKI